MFPSTFVFGLKLLAPTSLLCPDICCLLLASMPCAKHTEHDEQQLRSIDSSTFLLCHQDSGQVFQPCQEQEFNLVVKATFLEYVPATWT